MFLRQIPLVYSPNYWQPPFSGELAPRQQGGAPYMLYLVVSVYTDVPRVMVGAGCREFTSLSYAINWWSCTHLRPEFVSALVALRDACRRGEVGFVADGIEYTVNCTRAGTLIAERAALPQGISK